MKQLIIFCGMYFLSLSLLHAQTYQLKIEQFNLEDTAGNIYALSNLKGKTVYVDAWFPSCVPCIKEMPYNKLLQQRLNTMQLDSNIVFITICFRQSKEEWLAALHKIDMPNAIHLYSPASTYETSLTNGIYPSYRLFNNKGLLDTTYATRPSDFARTDFLLYAVNKDVPIPSALKIFDEDGFALLNNTKQTTQHLLLQSFFEKFMPYKKTFVDAFLAIK
jgi:thiol-disulfide isomerase/thioredoxin